MRIFVDSNIILVFFAGQDERVYQIIEDIENGVITGYINAIVVYEAIYRYLKLTTRLSSKGIRQLLARRDGKIIKLN